MIVSESKFNTPLGEGVLIKLVNAKGSWVELSPLGAGITALGVPDRDGRIENVALGYAAPADYLHDGPCMGKCPGRYANRIAAGKLRVAGRDYQLSVNCGPNHLHGGPEGFQNRFWDLEMLPDGVRFFRTSPDGEENYPGTLHTSVTYRWGDDDRLTILLEAEAEEETVVNLTNHTYWNLRGADSGNALGHILSIKASKWLVTDPSLAPTGELASVKGTPMDFRSPKTLGKDINADFEALRFGKGYDHCWALSLPEDDSTLREAVTLYDPASGRTLTLDTDQPGVQVYTGNWLSGSSPSRSGRLYADYDGVAIEAQGFPDAPNIPAFPSQSIKPGEPYRRVISYKFGCKK